MSQHVPFQVNFSDAFFGAHAALKVALAAVNFHVFFQVTLEHARTAVKNVYCPLFIFSRLQKSIKMMITLKRI